MFKTGDLVRFRGIGSLKRIDVIFEGGELRPVPAGTLATVVNASSHTILSVVFWGDYPGPAHGFSTLAFEMVRRCSDLDIC